MIFLVGIGVATTFSVRAQNLTFKNYSADDVLPSSNVYAAFQDSKGFMWFGTDFGVSRFDGYTFTTYTVKDGLADNEVFHFYEDKAGRIWFETRNGKVSYYKDGELFNSQIDSSLVKLDSESSITGMVEDDAGNLWISTLFSGIVCHTRDGNVHRFFTSKEMVRIHGLYLKDAKNEVMLMTQRGVFSVKFSQTKDSIVSTRFHDVGKKNDAHMPHPVSDSYAKAWRMSDTRLFYKDLSTLYICDLEKNQYQSISITDGAGTIYDLDEQGGSLWMGTSQGAFVYDLEKGVVSSSMLKSYAVTNVLKDVEGNYWFTTYGNGIFFCTSLEMFSYTTHSGLLTDKVSCLARDAKGHIWIGYGRMNESAGMGRISYIQNGKPRTFILSEMPVFAGLVTRQILFYENRCCVATTSGLFRVQGNHVDVWRCYARGVIEVPGGDVYIGYGDVLLHSSNRKLYHSRYNAPTIDPTAIYTPYAPGSTNIRAHPHKIKTMYLDKSSRLWAASDDSLFYIQDDRLVPMPPEQTGVRGLVSDFVELADSTLVMATHESGVVFNKGTRQVARVSEDDGLSSNHCNGLAVDADGTVWVATNNGLNKITGYPENITVEYLTIYDGMLSNDVTDVLVSMDTIWAATSKGLNFFHRNHMRRSIASPRVYIDRITMNGTPVTAEDLNGPEFKHNQNDVGIKYTGLLFSNGEPLVYRYKLHREDPWRYTKSTSVYLPGLPADKYEFIVSARGRSGQWSEEAVFTFSIGQPFWRSAFFIVSIILIVLGLVGWRTSVYIDQQRREIQRQHRVTMSELKSLRAQMNPHFLFNALNSIQGVLLKNNIETTQDYLGRFGKLMRLILDHSDKTTIGIREELESITNYLELEQLRAGHEFQYRIEIEPDLDINKTEIPAMILQPFIENAIWHGFGHKKDGSDLLIIRFGTVDEYVTITITDNGIGRKRAMAMRKREHKSKGIQLVRERIEILNFNSSYKIELTIEDLEDEHGNHPGTSVIIKIPKTSGG